MQASDKNSEVLFKFNGTGAVLMGRFDRDCGMVDVYVDDRYIRTYDNYYYVMDWGAGDGWLNGAHLFHVHDLDPGDHIIRLVINGEKNEKASDTRLKVDRAIVYEKTKDESTI